MELAAGLARSLILAAVIFLAFTFGGLPLIGVLVGIYLVSQLIEAVQRVEDRLEETNERLDRLTQRTS